MKLGVGRLEGIVQGVGSKMLMQTIFGDAFCQLGEEGEIGDRPVARQGFSVKRWFFDKRCDDSLLEMSGKDTCRKREINDVGDDWRENVAALLEE